MHIGSHEYANEADDDDVPKPAQSLGTPVPRQKVIVLPEQCSKGTVEGYVIEHDFIFLKFVQISFFLTCRDKPTRVSSWASFKKR